MGGESKIEVENLVGSKKKVCFSEINEILSPPSKELQDQISSDLISNNYVPGSIAPEIIANADNTEIDCQYFDRSREESKEMSSISVEAKEEDDDDENDMVINPDRMKQLKRSHVEEVIKKQ